MIGEFNDIIMCRWLIIFQHYIHYLSCPLQEDAWHKTPISCNDHQKYEEVFYFRSSSKHLINPTQHNYY